MIRRHHSRPRLFRPLLEQLEERRLLAAFITVNSTADTNARDASLTLREAMLVSNRSLPLASLSAAELLQVTGLPSDSDSDTIRFDIPASDEGHVYYKSDGAAGKVTLANVAVTDAADDAAILDIDPDWPHSWYAIRPTESLPDIAEAVHIDGYSQGSGTLIFGGDDALPNIQPTSQGLNSVLRVEINGEANDNAGDGSFGVLRLFGESAGNTTIRGLVVNRASTTLTSSVPPLIALDGDLGNNRLEGNYLGTDVSGSLALSAPPPEGTDAGDFVSVSTSDNVIGGVTAAARNLITALRIDSSTTRGLRNRVEGNLVGMNSAGSRQLEGALGGVGAGNESTIGGADAAARNVIAGGVALGSRNLLQNNLIGTDVTGNLDAGPGQGDVGDGIRVGGSGNRIVGNTVAFTGHIEVNDETGDEFPVAGGILVFAGEGNLISQNAVHSNVGPGIDLDADGPTENDVPPESDPPDSDAGANGLQNAPVLTSVAAVGGGTEIKGTLTSTPNSTFRLEFFANRQRDEEEHSAGQYSEGEHYLGSLDITTPANGVATFTANLPALPAGFPFVSATATDITPLSGVPRNNSSEFSSTQVVGGCAFVVTNTADVGLGTLREAVSCANLTTGIQTITFAIPPTDPRHFYYQDDGVVGDVTFENTKVTSAADDTTIADIDPDWPHSWFGIILDRELTKITETVTIDGYSQADSVRNTLPYDQGLNTVLRIELDGRNVAGNGITLASNPLGNDGGSVVQGLAINAFGGHGLELETIGGGNVIAGNFIGSDISGLLNFGNGGAGVLIIDEIGSSIGGPQAGQHNLISGNVGSAIEIYLGAGTVVRGNTINGDRNGQAAFATLSRTLILIHDDAQRVGLNSESLQADMTALDTTTPARPHSTQDNRAFPSFRTNPVGDGFSAGVIYLVATGKSPTEFGQYSGRGYSQARAEEEQARQQKASEPTNMARLLNSPSQVELAYLGADIGLDGVTPNDVGDLDGVQNFPTVMAATNRSGGTTITGTLNSLPNSTFLIEVYSSSYDTAVFRAGERPLGTIEVSTNSNGNATFTFDTTDAIPVGHHIVSLATRLFDFDNDPASAPEPFQTSEFSAGIAVRVNPWHNGAKPLDVKPDGFIVPADALAIIDYINAFGPGVIPHSAELGLPAYYDTTNDAFVAPNDVLDVINYINAFGADREVEGEAEGEAILPTSSSDDWLALLAFDVAQTPVSRRRAN